eukprot:jgi/Mesen1/5841/ME000298S05109
MAASNVVCLILHSTVNSTECLHAWEVKLFPAWWQSSAIEDFDVQRPPRRTASHSSNTTSLPRNRSLFIFGSRKREWNQGRGLVAGRLGVNCRRLRHCLTQARTKAPSIGIARSTFQEEGSRLQAPFAPTPSLRTAGMASSAGTKEPLLEAQRAEATCPVQLAPANEIAQVASIPAVNFGRQIPPPPSTGSQPGNLKARAGIALLAYLGVAALVYVPFPQYYTGTETNRWVDALYYSVVTLATVGYGDIVPSAPFTKLFTCVLVFAGIGFVATLLSAAGGYLLDKQQEEFLKKAQSTLGVDLDPQDDTDFDERHWIEHMWARIALALALIVLVLALGVGVLMGVEGYSLVDALYCACISVTTVGSSRRRRRAPREEKAPLPGVPGEADASSSQTSALTVTITVIFTLGGRLFAVFWLLLSSLAVAWALATIVEAQLEERQQALAQWHLHHKLTKSSCESCSPGQDVAGPSLPSPALLSPPVALSPPARNLQTVCSALTELLMADLNGDGRVEFSEFLVFKLKSMGKISDDDVTQIRAEFEKSDPDKSNAIELEEGQP